MKRQWCLWSILALLGATPVASLPACAVDLTPATAASAPTTAASASTASANVEPSVAEALRERIEDAGSVLHVNGSALPTESLRAVYAARQYRPMWVDGAGANARARQLMQTIGADASVGLTTKPFEPPAAADRARDPQGLATLELAFDGALLDYARSLGSGRTVPEEVDREYALTPPPFDPTATLMSAADTAELTAYLARLEPSDATYRGLKQALARVRAIAAAAPSWPALADSVSLKPGESSAAVPTLRRMLSAWGDYPGAASSSAPSSSKVYDASLVRALRRFQARHGLEPDGVVGARTRAALNVTPADRARQIVVNMERWRWMPRDLGNPHVVVNMAGFELEAVENGRPPLTMRVVVGQPFRRTPVFNDEITYLEFNPTWTVPKTIAIEDLLPKIRRDPGLLDAQGIRVLARGVDGSYAVNPSDIDWRAVGAGSFPYRLRQAPGPRNPLGRVKFIFPNPFSVYMHDTPSRQLFARSQRAYSSGCIRVEKPLELAQLLLEGTPGWDRERIDAVIAEGKTRRVILARPVPIHLVYLTAWQDGDGKLQFREDLYGRDAKLLQIIFKNAV